MISDDHLSMLRHALGYQQDGTYRRNGEPSHRNYYAAAPNDVKCQQLVSLGLMSAGQSIPGGLNYFHVTDAGRKVVLDAKPIPPKLTRGQQRYRDFLKADSGLSFFEWIQWQAGKREEERYSL